METQLGIDKHPHDGKSGSGGVISYTALTDKPNTLTDDQAAALAGTSGTPSSSNKFVTNDDTATAATADKVVRRDGDGAITVPATPDASTEAASKGYVDTAILYTSASDTNVARKQQSGMTDESFKVYLPGTIRVKVYSKTTSSFGDLVLYLVYPVTSGGTGTGAGFPDNDMVSILVNYTETATTNTYRTFDIHVRPGDIINVRGFSVSFADLQVNYTVNVKTSDYAVIL